MSKYTNYLKYSLLNTFNYRGRSGRTEYWTFSLFYLVLYLLCETIGGEMVSLLILLLLLPTGISLTVRRFHDIGWTGWWCLLALILPIFGVIIGFVDSGIDNEWSENPKKEKLEYYLQLALKGLERDFKEGKITQEEYNQKVQQKQQQFEKAQAEANAAETKYIETRPVVKSKTNINFAKIGGFVIGGLLLVGLIYFIPSLFTSYKCNSSDAEEMILEDFKENMEYSIEQDFYQKYLNYEDIRSYSYAHGLEYYNVLKEEEEKLKPEFENYKKEIFKTLKLENILTQAINKDIKRCDCEATIIYGDKQKGIRYSVQENSKGEIYVELN